VYDQPLRWARVDSDIHGDQSAAALARSEISPSLVLRGLLPYADQSPQVLAKLRRVQDDITLASLKRCVQKGLLTRPQASVLFRELGLTLPGTEIPVAGGTAPASPQPTPQPSPSTAP
jgi:hypothetical protein